MTPPQPPLDVIIIGAGMAGLSAALELKKRGLSFAVLEGASEAGGRAKTRILQGGIAADTGAHWLHAGKDNPLTALMRRYDLGYDADNLEQVNDHWHGIAHGKTLRDHAEATIDRARAERIKQGQESDCGLSDLATDAEGRELLKRLYCTWFGLDPDVKPSALEFLDDKSKPGGLQLLEGIEALAERLLFDAGEEHFHFRRVVTRVASAGKDVRVETEMGEAWTARFALFTGSLGVVRGGRVAFEPPPSSIFHDDLRHIVMGNVTKVTVALKPRFFNGAPGLRNLNASLLDAEPPVFCHLRGAGKPLATLFVGGKKALEVERMPSETLRDWLRATLAPMAETKGWEGFLEGEPLVSRWNENPLTLGAYPACLPGGKRIGPRLECRVCFAGDGFDTLFPASMAGAYRSGRDAAALLADALK